MNAKGEIPLPRKIRLAERGTREVFMLGKEVGRTAGMFPRVRHGKAWTSIKKYVPLSYATSLLCRIGSMAKNVKGELRKGFFVFLFVS